MKLLKSFYLKVRNSSMVMNGLWGIGSNFLQALFMSLFFVIVARKYPAPIFAQFLIANTVYQMIVAISSMGLGQWFIREYMQQQDKNSFTARFLKMQGSLGILFYLVNIIIVFLLYPEAEIRLLALILGTNIIFDNIIYGIKCLNTAQFLQKKSAGILVIDGFLKLCIGCLLFIYPFSIMVLSVLLVAVRLLTVNLFIRQGSAQNFSLISVAKTKISTTDIRHLLLLNWKFVVIGSISIIYWKLANVIISKMLTLQDVADYEIAFRIFAIFQILPTIAAATVFPQFVKLVNAGDASAVKAFYHKMFSLYTLFALLSYGFILSFSAQFIPFAFGSSYVSSVYSVTHIFLTFLIFPTVLLQANLIVAMKMEKMDMWFNILSLFINLTASLAGLYLYKSISVIHFSIFGSFVAFHIAQDILLVKHKISSVKDSISFYVVIAAVILFYNYGVLLINEYLMFGLFFCVVLMYAAFSFYRKDIRAMLTIKTFRFGQLRSLFML